MFTFSRKPDHPMADIKQARGLLDNLPKEDALKALEEITHWIKSVKETEGFRADSRAEIIMLLDETGLPFYSDLVQLYIGEPHLQDFKGHQLWQEIHHFKEAVSDGYAACIAEYQLSEKNAMSLKPVISTISVRLLRATLEQMQLNMMRYIEPDASTWDDLCSCYNFAVAHQLAGNPVKIYAKQASQTTPNREFLSAVILFLSSPATLAPVEIMACCRIIEHLVGSFVFKPTPDADCTHYIDLAKPSAPRRISGNLKVLTNMRFFGAGKATHNLAEIIVQHERAFIQSGAHSKSEFTPNGKLTVLKHLQTYWRKTPPSRSQDRISVTTTMEITRGIGTISQLITRIDQGNLVNMPTQKKTANNSPLINLNQEHFLSAIETWVVSDLSEGGVGGIIPKAGGGWVKIGELCGLKIENSDAWWVGMVRRIKTGANGLSSVGIEILAKKPLAVLLRLHRQEKQTDEKVLLWDADFGAVKYQDISVILLPDSNNSYANATMLMGSGCFNSEAVYELLMGTNNRNIKLTGILEEGADFEHVSFSLLS